MVFISQNQNCFFKFENRIHSHWGSRSSEYSDGGGNWYHNLYNLTYWLWYTWPTLNERLTANQNVHRPVCTNLPPLHNIQMLLLVFTSNTIPMWMNVFKLKSTKKRDALLDLHLERPYRMHMVISRWAMDFELDIATYLAGRLYRPRISFK